LETYTRRAIFYLGAEWVEGDKWMWLSRDLAADFVLAVPGETLSQVYGVKLHAGYVNDGWAHEMWVDDISFSAWNRGVVRHGAAEWTEGASYWPTGPQELDVSVYNHYDHLGAVYDQGN